MKNKSLQTVDRKPKRIRWITVSIVSAIFALTSWAISSPVGSSPDDDFHLSSIWCGQGLRDGLCEEGNREGSYKIPFTAMANSVCFAGFQNVSGFCKQDNSLVEYPIINNNYNLYPKLFYWTMSWFATEDVVSSTLLMRIVNSILSIGLFSIVILSLPHHLRRIPILTLLLTSMPLGVFLVSSTNPSSWSYVGLTVLLTSFIGFLSETNTKSKTILGILSLLGFFMATGARADAAPYAALAILISWLVSKVNRKLFAINSLVSITILSLALYFFQSVGTATSIVSGGGLRLPPESSSTPSIFDNLMRIPELWAGIFGTWGLGWLDTPMPGIVWLTSIGITSAVVFSSIRWFDSRQTVAFGFSLLALVVVPFYVLMSNNLSVGEQVQPRYLLPLMAFLVAIASFRRDSNSGLKLSVGQLVTVGVGLALANSVSLHTNIRRYTTGVDLKGINLDTRIEWWWENTIVSPNFVWVLGSLSFAIAIFSIWKISSTLGLPTLNARQHKFGKSI
jgi:hypothetical protein